MNKKLENIEYLIKIEQRNKKQTSEKFEKQIDKLEKQIEKQESELEKCLKELNLKEAKIFEVQKLKLETFKSEISKYEKIYKDLEDKNGLILKEIDCLDKDEEQSYNYTYMLYEDYLSYSNEIYNNKKRIKEIKESLSEIEKTYPKEFEFLLEDISLEKELNEIIVQKSKKKKIFYNNLQI